MNLEDELVAWARQLGCKDSSSLTKASIAKLCRGPHRDFWEFAIKNFKSAEEVKQIKGLLSASSGSDDVAAGRNDSRAKAAQQEAAQAAKLRAALPRITETNATLKKMRDVSMKQYQDKLQESLNLESKEAALQQSLAEKRAQLHALQAYRQRWESLLQLLGERSAVLAGARAWARGRVQAASGRSQGSVASQVEAVTLKTRRDLEHYVQQRWGVALTTAGSIGAPGSAAAAAAAASADAAAAASGAAAASVEALMTQSPLETLAALMQLTREASAKVASSSSEMAEGGPQQREQQVADPLVLLQERQKVHVDRFIDSQQAFNSASDLSRRLQQMVVGDAGVQALMQRKLNRMQVQVAGHRARLLSLHGQLRSLHSQCGTGSAGPLQQHPGGSLSLQGDVQMQLHSAFEAIGSQRRFLEQLSDLILHLSEEGGALVQSWEAEEERWSVAVHTQLPGACDSAAQGATLSSDLVSSEVAAWQQVPPHLLQPTSLHHQQQQQQQQDASTSSNFSSASTPVLLLHRYQQALPLLQAAASTLQQQQQLSSSSVASSSSSRVAAAAGALSSMQLTDPQGRDLGLARVLCGLASLDSLCPLRCPASVHEAIAGHQLQLQQYTSWLAAAEQDLGAPSGHMEWHYERYRAVRRALEGVRHADLNDRLPRAEQALSRLSALRAHYDGPFRRTTLDCRELPAVNLLPEVKVDGCSSAEWLLAVRDSHAMLRVLREEVAGAS